MSQATHIEYSFQNLTTLLGKLWNIVYDHNPGNQDHIYQLVFSASPAA